jgi:hypothetical protein
MIHRTLVAALAVLVAGCAQVTHVATGDITVRDRLLVTVDKPWNQFERGLSDNTPTWTQDGISVDALRFYVGLKDGALLAPAPNDPKAPKPPTFRQGMQAADVVSMFEGLYARDGSTFKLDKVAPHPFLGGEGFRFEFSSIRKHDEVRLSGVGWGAVRNGELYAITYTAPRLSFFSRHVASVEAIAKSARIRN